jgi:hypothetical protein
VLGWGEREKPCCGCGIFWEWEGDGYFAGVVVDGVVFSAIVAAVGGVERFSSS